MPASSRPPGTRRPREKIRVFVAADAGRAADGRAAKQVEVDESANELRKRVKALDVVVQAGPSPRGRGPHCHRDRPPPGSEQRVCLELHPRGRRVQGRRRICRRRRDGDHRRHQGARIRRAHQLRRPTDASWDELAKQFAKSLEAFAKANYDRMLRQREQRRPQ